ncbi:hypothetical protein F511_36335 [Dorcoceras hygrometricum]|uniref:Uncharacterized protein n=1 Tax=Dorcoceras hygrometricum TaxID=472368 RepID=A0A2Z7BL38_9LAMI|nr:hypothetical protein F511_36335 [Dorcoceras hygrometricum]
MAHSISILLVDDDLICLSHVANMLKKFNYEVVMARHPQDAIYTLRLKKGAFDLVVSDVHMPDMDGFELTKAIAQEFDLPVILMSADIQDSTFSKVVENGVAFFLPKPVSAHNLRDIWRFASTRRRRQTTTVEEIRRLPEPETSSEKTNLVEIIAMSASSDDKVNDVEKDLNEKELGKRVCNENSEVSASSSPKKPKLIWTNSLHNQFLQAIRRIGLDRAVPKKILEVMNVPGLTRENVASHLQKYRLFLRRVSDANFKTPSGSEEKFTSSTITPSGSNSWTSIFDNRQHPCRFPNSSISASSSSILTGSTYARILANEGDFCKPYVACSNFPIRNTDCSNLPKYGLSACLTAPSSGGNIGTSSNVASMQPITHQTNYVGYSISNLQRLAVSGMFKINQDGVQSDNALMDVPNAAIHRNNLSLEANSLDEHSSFDDILDQLFADSSSTESAPNNNDEIQLSNVIAEYQKLINKSNISVQNGMENGELCSNGLFDLEELDTVMPTQQPLDGVQSYHTTLPVPASFENHQEQRAGTNTDLGYDPLEFNASASQLNNISLSPIQVCSMFFTISSFITFFCFDLGLIHDSKMASLTFIFQYKISYRLKMTNFWSRYSSISPGRIKTLMVSKFFTYI